MLFFPSQPLQKMMCTTSVHQVKSASQSKFSFCMCLPCTSGLTDKERSRDGGGTDILLQRDNTFPIPDFNHHFFPNARSLAWCCSSQLQISEGRDGLTQVGGLSWLWKPSQLLMSLRSALLVSGAFIRLRECDVSTSQRSLSLNLCRQRKQMGITASTADSKRTGDPWGFLLRCWH